MGNGETSFVLGDETETLTAYARLALFGISAFIADEDMRVDEFKDWANGLFVVEPAENIGADKESAK